MGLAEHSDLRAPEGEATDVQMMRLNFASKDIEYVILSAVVREDLHLGISQISINTCIAQPPGLGSWNRIWGSRGFFTPSMCYLVAHWMISVLIFACL